MIAKGFTFSASLLAAQGEVNIPITNLTFPVCVMTLNLLLTQIVLLLSQTVYTMLSRRVEIH